MHAYDDRKMPREALAYVMDSTGAPVCVLILLSAWAVFYANLFYAEDYVSSQYSSFLGIDKTADFLTIAVKSRFE